jgi:hypothetical protein
MTSATFRAQLRWLHAKSYYSVSSERLAGQMASGQPS